MSTLDCYKCNFFWQIELQYLQYSTCIHIHVRTGGGQYWMQMTGATSLVGAANMFWMLYLMFLWGLLRIFFGIKSAFQKRRQAVPACNQSEVRPLWLEKLANAQIERFDQDGQAFSWWAGPLSPLGLDNFGQQGDVKVSVGGEDWDPPLCCFYTFPPPAQAARLAWAERRWVEKKLRGGKNQFAWNAWKPTNQWQLSEH